MKKLSPFLEYCRRARAIREAKKQTRENIARLREAGRKAAK